MADGIEISMEVAATGELLRYILGFRAEAEILEPPALRAQTAELHAGAAARYGAKVIGDAN